MKVTSKTFYYTYDKNGKDVTIFAKGRVYEAEKYLQFYNVVGEDGAKSLFTKENFTKMFTVQEQDDI